MVVLQIFINDDMCGKTPFMALNKLNSTVRKRVKIGIFRRLSESLFESMFTGSDVDARLQTETWA